MDKSRLVPPDLGKWDTVFPAEEGGYYGPWVTLPSVSTLPMPWRDLLVEDDLSEPELEKPPPPQGGEYINPVFYPGSLGSEGRSQELSYSLQSEHDLHSGHSPPGVESFSSFDEDKGHQESRARRRNTVVLVLVLCGLLALVAAIAAATMWGVVRASASVPGSLERGNNTAFDDVTSSPPPLSNGSTATAMDNVTAESTTASTSTTVSTQLTTTAPTTTAATTTPPTTTAPTATPPTTPPPTTSVPTTTPPTTTPATTPTTTPETTTLLTTTPPTTTPPTTTPPTTTSPTTTPPTTTPPTTTTPTTTPPTTTPPTTTPPTTTPPTTTPPTTTPTTTTPTTSPPTTTPPTTTPPTTTPPTTTPPTTTPPTTTPPTTTPPTTTPPTTTPPTTTPPTTTPPTTTPPTTTPPTTTPPTTTPPTTTPPTTTPPTTTPPTTAPPTTTPPTTTPPTTTPPTTTPPTTTPPTTTPPTTTPPTTTPPTTTPPTTTPPTTTPPTTTPPTTTPPTTTPPTTTPPTTTPLTTTPPTTTLPTTTPTTTVPTTTMPPAYALMTSSNVTLGSPLRVTCQMVFNPSWRLVVLFRRFNASDPSGLLVPQTAFQRGPDGRPVSVPFNPSAQASAAGSSGNESFTLTFAAANCSDSGLYVCRSDNNVSASIVTQVSLTPAEPVLDMPSDHLANRTTTLTCRAEVSITGGDLYWAVRKVGETSFTSYEWLNTTREVLSSTNCSRVLRLRSDPVLDMSWNATEISCRSRNPDYEGQSQSLSVLPNDICEGKIPGINYPHPYTCSKFVLCSSSNPAIGSCPPDLCYEPATDECVDPSGP